ncbi:MAG: hypothetical protein PHE01_02920 [Methanosarcina sp.]|jgi:hypothetical protein|nr:hypothetical protein [Methanosarcina sp.]
MIKGINLTLMIGPAVPVPVSQEVLEALTSVKVTSTTEGASGFELTFTLSNRSPLTTLFLLSGGNSIPLVRVMIVVTINGTPEVLMDGVMTNHEITPGQSGQSTLTVIGEDLTRVMDYIDFSGIPYPAMPVEARIALILAKYTVLGVVPVVIPTMFTEVPIPTQQIPRQQGKDLGYIRELARDAGYIFYIEPGPIPGMNIAYWGPEIKTGIPQPALNINMDAHTNVETLSFNFNSEAKTQPIVYIHNELTKVPIPIPVPDFSLLNPPLGMVLPIAKNINQINGAAKFSPVKAALAGIAQASGTSDVVTASGSLNVLRYGHVLKARRLVGVRGAGTAFDGLYYVKSVTHNIKRGEYKENFTLSRNGLISTLPVVPV